MIPNIQRILHQRGYHVTLKLIRDILSDYHKNGRRKWLDDQLDESHKRQKRIMGHVTNRLSEVYIFFPLILIFSSFFFDNFVNYRKEKEEGRELYR